VLACDRSAAVQGPAAAFWHDTAAVAPASGPPHTLLLLHKSPVQRLTALLQQVSGLKVQLIAIWAAAGVEPALAEAVARDAESRWPCVAAGLLMRLPAEMADAWGRSLFVNDLADCVFTDYPVQTQVIWQHLLWLCGLPCRAKGVARHPRLVLQRVGSCHAVFKTIVLAGLFCSATT
jgi:hypothetical protein